MTPNDIIEHLDTRAAETIDHILKTHPEPFQAVWDGLKPYEVRRCDDRDFVVGQSILLLEWVPDRDLTEGGIRARNEILTAFGAATEHPGYTGRSIACEISYLTPGGEWGLPRELCVFGLCNLQRDEGPHR